MAGSTGLGFFEAHSFPPGTRFKRAKAAYLPETAFRGTASRKVKSGMATRGGEMTLPCPGGQGGAAVCACDAVCPAGKSAAERRAGYRCITEKAVPQALCASGGFVGAPGNAKSFAPPLPRQRFSLAIPRGDRRALPAPAQGTSPLGIPFWGTGLTFPPSPRPPKRRRRQAPARGPAAVYPHAARCGTKRSAHAPYSWGMGASTSSRRHWPAALPP